ncbi:MAG: molybdate ABC transporter substrate-binding protein [Myxococcales bacterium]|nr:molybdate ABC transporter substrate-binding protein [Myxococcales bacterium]
MTLRSSVVLALATVLLPLAACEKRVEPAPGNAAAPAPSAKPEATSVLVLNAASTKESLNELGAAFEKSTAIKVKFSPEDSSKLANQIAEGAPADIFLSANEKWADFVKDKGLAAETKPLLGNTLVVVVPTGNPAKVAGPDDLKKGAVKKLAIAGPTVPAGIYAKASLTSLKLWDDLEKSKKLTPGENVRGTLAFVERGEVDAGIIYATDAKVSQKVEVAYTFDPSTHPKIVYPLVLLKRGAQREGAKKFFEFLQSKEAADVFKKAGFTSLIGS